MPPAAWARQESAGQDGTAGSCRETPAASGDARPRLPPLPGRDVGARRPPRPMFPTTTKDGLPASREGEQMQLLQQAQRRGRSPVYTAPLGQGGHRSQSVSSDCAHCVGEFGEVASECSTRSTTASDSSKLCSPWASQADLVLQSVTEAARMAPAAPPAAVALPPVRMRPGSQGPPEERSRGGVLNGPAGYMNPLPVRLPPRSHSSEHAERNVPGRRQRVAHTCVDRGDSEALMRIISSRGTITVTELGDDVGALFSSPRQSKIFGDGHVEASSAFSPRSFRSRSQTLSREEDCSEKLVIWGRAAVTEAAMHLPHCQTAM